MRNYIILNGTNSNTINGLLIQELAPISKPLMRTEIEEIDGRDGDIITPLGFSAYDKEITIGLYGNFDINQIIAFFNSEGTVTFSNEPDKYYNYTIFQQIDFERLVRFKTATVTLHCQPFKFATTGETQTLDSGDPVSDEGTNLVLEGSQLAPFSQFDLKGNTEQQTYSGKNLTPYPYYAGSSYVARGITFTANSDGSVVLNGKNDGTANSAYMMFNNSSSPMQLEAGTYYFIPPSNTNVGFVMYDGTSYYDFASGSNFSHTFSSAVSIRQIYIQVRKGNTTTFSNLKVFPMLTTLSGQTEADYEPYTGGTASPNPDYPQAVQTVTGENVVKIHGKNLFDISVTTGRASQGLTTTIGADGVIHVAGTANSTWADFTNSQPIRLKSGETYTVSIGSALPCNLYLRTASPNQNAIIYKGQTSATFVADSDKSSAYFYCSGLTSGTRYDFTICNIQIEKSSQATDFEAYQEQSYPISLGSIELCKIGGYQDYIWKDGDTWKVHKAINKAVLNGSEANWATQTSGGLKRYSVNRTDSKSFSSRTADASLSSHFTPSVTDAVGIFFAATQTYYFYPDQSIATLDSWKTWLASNNVALYYQLATPTDTAIADTTLIEQLDAIANQAHAYKTRTYVDSNAATGNVPHIIAATVVGSADGTVTNAGNIYSKPKLTIYGSGDVGVYLNGVQMLQIALGTLGNITIDTDLMEAYTGTIDNLQNRAVTGDYSNFKLAVGANKISFSGSVTSCIVENFSRWL